MISPKTLSASMSYEAYLAHLESIVAQSHHISIHLVEHSTQAIRMNLIKMERLDKAARITANTRFFMNGFKKDLIWLVLTHPESEDAAQVLPILNKMAGLYPGIQYKIALPEAIEQDQELAKLSHSVFPKLVIIQAGEPKILATWGPRVVELEALIKERDADLSNIKSGEILELAVRQWGTRIQRWYAKDKTYSIQKELLEILKNL
jgi:hypothetical protein